jgi:hypothetical protein
MYVAAMPLGAGGYQPRDAEHAVLYRVINEHLEAFLETARRHADGSALPAFVAQEFREFLTCGVLAHGHLRQHLVDEAGRAGWRTINAQASSNDREAASVQRAVTRTGRGVTARRPASAESARHSSAVSPPASHAAPSRLSRAYRSSQSAAMRLP